jgi:anti-sigma regulatory factor (Ser/Thr protein kinase)
MTRADRAIALHRGGSACSQAVFAVFAQELGLPPAPAHRLAGGFGAGMGLANVKRVSDEFEITSKKGSGTTVKSVINIGNMP